MRVSEMTKHLFLEPLDVLFFRGNRLFGDPGSYGEAMIPPWPSVAAGALRSRMLADRRAQWHGGRNEPLPEDPEIGGPERPGSFTVTAFHLARRGVDGAVEALLPPPADLVVTEGGASTAAVLAMRPRALAEGIGSSFPFAMHPVLPQASRDKAGSGWWLAGAGWRRYLNGEAPCAEELVHQTRLWHTDERVGVGLDLDRRRASDGRLFTVQAMAPVWRGAAGLCEQDVPHDVGFLVSVSGAEPPDRGLLRLGGDGRAVAIHPVGDFRLPNPDWEAVVADGRCRLVLTAPGLFPDGWLPAGTCRASGEMSFDLCGVRGRLVCAAVPRAGLVSGWDLARWRPKTALRAAPPGSVYWLELEPGVTIEALRSLADRGLWSDEDWERNPRRAEGFNRVAVARWPN